MIVLDGTNGVSTPNTFAFKNRLINSQLLINQRGVSGTVTLSAGAYGHDRFKAGASGCTYTFATSNNVTTLTISAGSLQQVVEGLNLESGTYTLSWTGTVQGKFNGGAYSASGVTGSITGGTNTTVEFNTGTLSLSQLEKGSVATSFDQRAYSQELAMCQRYYQNIICSVTDNGAAAATKVYNTSAPYQCQMRATPTATFSALVAYNVTSITFTNIYNIGATYTVTASGGPSMFSVSSVFLSAEL